MMLGEHKGREEKMLTTEGLFRKSTFCTSMDVNSVWQTCHEYFYEIELS